MSASLFSTSTAAFKLSILGISDTKIVFKLSYDSSTLLDAVVSKDRLTSQVPTKNTF
jgi:hypothetical protein